MSRSRAKNWIEQSRCWVTSPRDHPESIEFLRYEPDSTVPDLVKDNPHFAYRVDDIAPHIKGQQIIIPPFVVAGFVEAVFIWKHGTLRIHAVFEGRMVREIDACVVAEGRHPRAASARGGLGERGASFEARPLRVGHLRMREVVGLQHRRGQALAEPTHLPHPEVRGRRPEPRRTHGPRSHPSASRRMSYRAIYSYAWDIAETGVAPFVYEVKALGLNTVTFAGSYHAGKFIRPKGRAGKVYFPEDGTVYFRTDPARYGSIKPIENHLLRDRDILRELADTDLAVNAWMVLLHNTRLGRASRRRPSRTPSAIVTSTACARRLRRCGNTPSHSART